MKNFCRIYPARNSKLYDRFFSSSKALAKVLYRVLHTPEIVPFGIVSNQAIISIPTTTNQTANKTPMIPSRNGQVTNN